MDTTKLTHDIEEILIDNLIKTINESGKRYRAILIAGRGGLSIAQKIAYELNIEDITFNLADQFECLFVDDISCTGTTLSMIDCDTATLIYRTSSKVKPTFFALEVNSAKYIKFSWEK